MNKNSIQISKIKNKKLQKNITKFDNNDYFEPPYNFDQLSELYKLNSYHQRCINVKANITAGLGYKIVSIAQNREKDDEYEMLLEFLNNLNKNSNSYLIEMLIRLQTDYEIFGNSWLEITRNQKGYISEIYHIPAQYVKIKKDNLTAIIDDGDKKYELIRFGSGIERGKNEFIHIKNYNPSDSVYGIPEYISALPSMLLDKNILEYNIHRLLNRTTPEALITITGAELNQIQKEEILDFFENNYQGLSNAGKVLLIQNKNKDAMITLKEVKTTLLEGVFRGLRKELRDEIIAIHGVPPRLIGVVTTGQLGGVGEVKEQNRIFKEIVIAPRKKRLENYLFELIRQGLGVENWKIVLNEYDISDNLDDAKLLEILIRNKIITTEEARERLF